MLKHYISSILSGTISTFVIVLSYTLLSNYVASENTPNLEALFVVLLMYCGIFSAASLPVLLSKNKKIENKNFIVSLLWFLLPSLLVIFVFASEIMSNIEQNIPITLRHLDYAILFNFPFILSLLVNYFILKKEIKTKSKLQN